MHKNYYENLATREDVEDALGEVRRLVDAVAGALGEGVRVSGESVGDRRYVRTAADPSVLPAENRLLALRF
jgi:hypothetical protein